MQTHLIDANTPYRLLYCTQLHAHLHGCIRRETVRDLAAANGISMSPEQHRALAPGADRTLSDCFKLFEIIRL